MTPFDPNRSTLTSAASMRVLAHPTGLRLLGLLRERGAQTAAQLGDVVDEAPGTVSYHLAKLGIHRPDRGGRAAELSISGSAGGRLHDRPHELGYWAQLLDDPDKAAASSGLQKSIGQAYAARYSDYIDSLPSLPREWVEAGSIALTAR